jgi:quercetin dioxygenase-like cupin family protein
MQLKSKSAGFTLAFTLMLGGAFIAQKSPAQAPAGPGVVRTVVTRADAAAPGKEAVIVRVEFPVGGMTGKHTHFGEEISYVTDGEGELNIAGQPPKKLKVGDGFIVPSGAVHEAHNTGTQPLKLVAVFVVEKGKPLTNPVP